MAAKPLIRISCALLTIGAASWDRIALAECPVNRLQINYVTRHQTQAAVFDSTNVYGDPGSFAGTAFGHIAYDMHRGDIRYEVGAGFNGYGQGSVELSDEFRIESLPTSAPVPFRVVLQIHYSGKMSGGGAAGGASIETGETSISAEWGFGPPVDSVLFLPLIHVAGEVFRVTFRLTGAGSEGGISISGRYRFEGLPPESRIISCQGYRGAPDLGVNALRMDVTPRGFIAYDPFRSRPGLEYPRGSGRHLIFAAGLWVSAMVDGEMRMAVSDYRADEFSPVLPPSDRVFELRRSYSTVAARESALADYMAFAIPVGAPPVTVEGNGELSVPGDQMLWHAYHDANPAKHAAAAGSTAPLGLEVRQTAFAFSRPGMSSTLDRAIFLSFDLVNPGVTAMRDARATFWFDPDVGQPSDDRAGCDSTRGLGFAYNGAATDPLYGTRVPAVAVDLLKGPLDAGGVPVPAAGFQRYTYELYRATSTRNMMLGLETDGTDIVNPMTGRPTRWTCSGDPVAGNGWLDALYGDKRLMLLSGAFDIPPGATQTIVFAILVGDSLDRLGSVAQLMETSDAVQALFDSGFDDPTPVAASLVEQQATTDRVRLTWQGSEIQRAYVDRAWHGGGWTRLDTLLADGEGRFHLEDLAIRAGERYGYRLLDPALGEVPGSEVWIDVPVASEFGLAGVHPNPSRNGWAVSFTLPRRGAARLELIDLQGRRCAESDLGRLGSGNHVAAFEPRGVPAGLYLLRLRTDFGVRATKVVLLAH